MSRQVHLDIGQQYYIEALHKIGTGLDHMTVGVTLPNGVKEWPIPRKYLRYRPLGMYHDKLVSISKKISDYFHHIHNVQFSVTAPLF